MLLRDDIKFYGKYARYGASYVAGQLELTTRCFQRCAHCQSWREAEGAHAEWSLEDAKGLLMQLCEMHFEHLSFTGGDPQAWPHLPALLAWFQGRYALQISTALMRDLEPAEAKLWREKVADVRVSLDAASLEGYEAMRGVAADPLQILDRLRALQHPRPATMTTVSEANIDEIPRIVSLLSGMNLRRAMFLPALGVEHSQEFWLRYRDLTRVYSSMHWTSFNETVAFAAMPSETKCWVRNISFHIKANGDLYPCCLVGGEAITTDERFRLGNVHQNQLRDIRARTFPVACYGRTGMPCDAICQYKQRQMNAAAEAAGAVRLSMP